LFGQGLEWTQLPEPSGTQISEILVTSQNEIFLSTFFGVFKSTDHGNTWKFNHRLLQDNDIKESIKSSAYAMLTGAPDSVRQLLFCTSWIRMWWTRCSLCPPEFYVWGSRDGGDTWQFGVFGTYNPDVQNGNNWRSAVGLNLGFPYLSYWSGGTLFLAGEEPGVLFGDPSQNYVVRSTDTAKSWRNSLKTPQRSKTVGLQNSQPTLSTREALFALFNNGKLYRTLDTGNTWTECSFTSFTRSDSDLTLVAKSGKVVVFSKTNGAYLSTDLGETWKDVSVTLPVKRIYSITIDEENRLIAALPAGVFRSLDYGTTWTGPLQGLPPNAIGKLACDSSDILYACASPNAGNNWSGVYLSTDHGTTWFTRNSGLPSLPVQSLAADTRGNLLSSAYGGGLFRTTDNGETWSLEQTDYALPLTFNSTGKLYAGRGNGLPFLISTSTDVGLSWSSRKPYAPYSFATAGDGSMVMSTYQGEVLRTTDDGLTWDSLASPPYDPLSKLGHYFLLGVSHGTGTLYAAAPLAIYQSKDTGRSWEQLNANLLGEISAMMVDSQDNIWIGMKDGRVTVSRNGGFSWTLTDIKSPMGFISCFLVTRQGEIFAATSTDTSQGASGVYRMTSNTSWIPINKGLIPKGYSTYPRIASLAVTSSGKIFAGTTDYGIFRLDVENAVSSPTGRERNREGNKEWSKELETATLTSLSPNPARVSSAVTIDLKERQEITLNVYDPLGRVVTTLLEGTLEPGSYTTHLNTIGLAPGSYFIRLIGKHTVSNKALVIVK